VGVTGTEHIADSPVNQALSKVSAADSGAVSLDSYRTDQLLTIVLGAWPRLSADDRVAVVATIQAMLDK
jgi:hypothetical protein